MAALRRADRGSPEGLRYAASSAAASIVNSVGDLLSELERAAALFAGDARPTPRDDGVGEIGELEPQRFGVLDRDVAAMNRRRGATAGLEAIDLQLLCRVIDRHVGCRLKEADLADAVAADAAPRGGHGAGRHET